jgi:cytochrome P450
MTTATRTLRGPKPRFLVGNFRDYGRDPLGFMTQCAREYGDFVPIRFGPFTAYLASGPAEVEELLVQRQKDFRKSRGTQVLRPIVGNGLLTAEGDFWRRQRRLASPAFHRERVNSYARTMVDFTQEHAEAWEVGRELDLHHELMALTYRIVVKVLFDAEVEGRVAEVARANAEIQRHLENKYSSMKLFLPDWVPTRGNIRFRRWIRRLDQIVFALIRERKAETAESPGRADVSATGGRHGDLLDMLMAARDDEGRRMTDRQLRDEVMTLMLAGHETTALALSWALLLLMQNPEAIERMRAELREVLGGRAPTPADMPALNYTRAVIDETMRLYPPAYTTGREAIRETQVGGVRIGKRGTVLVAQWVTHRDPRWFDSPDSFRPERWLDGLAKRLPRGAYYPFGLGPRMCIGAQFALMEATLILATIVQKWGFELAPGQALEAQPAVTLRPRNGLRAVPLPVA